MKHKVRTILLVFFTATFLISVAVLATPLVQHQIGLWNFRKQHNQLNQMYQDTLAAQSGVGQPPAPTEPADTPDVPIAPTVLPQFAPFLELNDETVGWLTLGGEDFSAPVAQHSDNNYYLSHDFYGKPDENGAVALDHRNEILPDADGFYDDNWVLYAHNLQGSDLMFNALTKFRDAAYLAAHPVIAFDTLYEEGQYAIFAVFLTNTDPNHGPVFDYHNYLRFPYKSEQETYLDYVNVRSMLHTGVDVNESDRLLTLSTCSYEFSDARLVVMARRLRPGETAAQFNGLQVQKNPNALMPDIWVSTYGQKSPASAAR